MIVRKNTSVERLLIEEREVKIKKEEVVISVVKVNKMNLAPWAVN